MHKLFCYLVVAIKIITGKNENNFPQRSIWNLSGIVSREEKYDKYVVPLSKATSSDLNSSLDEGPVIIIDLKRAESSGP